MRLLLSCPIRILYFNNLSGFRNGENAAEDWRRSSARSKSVDLLSGYHEFTTWIYCLHILLFSCVSPFSLFGPVGG